MSTNSEKEANLYVSEPDLLLDSYRLGRMVFDSGFRPSFIVGLWRGGSTVGIAVQECLQYLGVETDHISVRTSYTGVQSYSQMLEEPGKIRVHGLRYLYENLNSEDNLLIVDDVFGSGSSVNAVIQRLRDKCRLNMPQNIKIAAPWFRDTPTAHHTRSETKRIQQPDYYVHQTSRWLVLPYELSGLTEEEIVENKPDMAHILQQIRPYLVN